LTSGGTLKWRQTIMKNGDKPNVAQADQLMFRGADGKPLFGLNAMYNPTSGRLLFARGRLGVIFAHYNHFGMNKDGTRNDHTGDTFVSYSLTNPADVKLGWSFLTSHSLVTKMVYDGSHFVSASLGDAYPENILFARTETGAERPGKTLSTVSQKNVVAGMMPGNHGGSTVGRLGDIHIMSRNSKTYSATYARKAATLSATSTSNVNELGYVAFNSKLVRTGAKAVLALGTVTALGSARYGNAIAIVFVKQMSNTAQAPWLPTRIEDNKGSLTQQHFLVFSQLDGTKLTNPLLIAESLGASEGLSTLTDGSVIWPSISVSGELLISRIPGPQLC